jgi:hypothetical protein
MFDREASRVVEIANRELTGLRSSAGVDGG